MAVAETIEATSIHSSVEQVSASVASAIVVVAASDTKHRMNNN